MAIKIVLSLDTLPPPPPSSAVLGSVPRDAAAAAAEARSNKGIRWLMLLAGVRALRSSSSSFVRNETTRNQTRCTNFILPKRQFQGTESPEIVVGFLN